MTDDIPELVVRDSVGSPDFALLQAMVSHAERGGLTMAADGLLISEETHRLINDERLCDRMAALVRAGRDHQIPEATQ